MNNLDFNNPKYHRVTIYNHFCNTKYLENNLKIIPIQVGIEETHKHYWKIIAERDNRQWFNPKDTYYVLTWFDFVGAKDDPTKQVIALVIGITIEDVDALYEMESYKFKIKREQEQFGFLT